MKQGGILSPFFYTLYVNDLLIEQDSSGLGACVSDVFVGSPMYADDLALVAATASDLQGMLNIVHVVTPGSGSTSLMPANLRYLSLDAESLSPSNWTLGSNVIEAVLNHPHLGVLRSARGSMARTNLQLSKGRSSLVGHTKNTYGDFRQVFVSMWNVIKYT